MLKMACLKTKKNELGQFDTPPIIASSLLKLFNYNYDLFIDLGAGLGNLSSTLHQNNGVLIELDEQRYNLLRKKNNQNLKVIHGDVLDYSINLNSICTDKKSLFISNPPFNRKKSDYIFSFFENLNIGSSFHQLDIVFLDKVLTSVKNESSLVFIVSAPFVEFEKYENERKKFLECFSFIEIISLDINTFEQAEVQSYAIIAHKTAHNPTQSVCLKSMNIYGEITDLLVVSKNDAIKNMDILFHKQIGFLHKLIGKKFKTIRDFNVSLARGSKSKKYFNDLGKNFIHTTDLVDEYLYLESDIDERFSLASQNDILISRVGRRSIARQSFIKEGDIIFTDSVYRLKTDIKDNDIIWKSISSEIGQKWRELHAQGKCAKYLTCGAVLSIPVI